MLSLYQFQQLSRSICYSGNRKISRCCTILLFPDARPTNGRHNYTAVGTDRERGFNWSLWRGQMPIGLFFQQNFWIWVRGNTYTTDGVYGLSLFTKIFLWDKIDCTLSRWTWPAFRNPYYRLCSPTGHSFKVPFLLMFSVISSCSCCMWIEWSINTKEPKADSSLSRPRSLFKNNRACKRKARRAFHVQNLFLAEQLSRSGDSKTLC